MNGKDICKEDNRLQRKLLRGEMSKEEFDFRKIKLHKDYSMVIGEKELIEKILKKHGGAEK